MKILGCELRVAASVMLAAIVVVASAFVGNSFSVSDEPAAAPADGVPPKKKNRRPKAENRFDVPMTNNVGVLMKFVEQLEEFSPDSEDDLRKLTTLVPAAIRTACERILQIEKNERAAAHRFATRRLLQMEFDELEERNAKEVPAPLVARAEKYLADSEHDLADAEFAMSIGAALEQLGTESQAEQFYSRSGKTFAASRDREIAKLGQAMLGAGRRLGLKGQAMEIRGTTLQGQPFDLATLKGKVVLVDFWTTWCGFCIDEFPNLKRSYSAYKSKGFEIVSVNCDEDRETLDKFLKLNSLPWTTLHDDDHGADQPAAIQYGISGYPAMFLLDREGKLVTTKVRGRSLRKELRKLLGPPDTISKTQRTVPVMNNDEVIDNLMDTLETLLADGKLKDLATLRKNIGRKSAEIALLPARETKMTDQEVFRRVSESVFVVGGLHRSSEDEEWEIALATAFVVAADGVLCTSSHVFLDDLEIQGMVVMDSLGRTYPVEEILAADDLADTCFFRIPARDLKPLPFGDDAVPGDALRIVSHPGNMFFYLSSGQVANYFLDDDGATWMNVSADFGQGSSGAPVLDAQGNVIGQVSRTSTLFAVGDEEASQRRAKGRRVHSAGASRASRKAIVIESPRQNHDAAKALLARRAKTSQLEELSLSTTVLEPQMVFKSCTPVEQIKKLVLPKK